MSNFFMRRAAILLIGLVIACVYMSAKELRYVFFAKTVDAKIEALTQQTVVRREGSMPYPQLRVDYSFQDGERTRNATDAVDPEWPVSKGSITVPVEYIPGTDSSRLKGNDHKGWLWGSGAMLVVGLLCGGVWWKYRDA